MNILVVGDPQVKGELARCVSGLRIAPEGETLPPGLDLALVVWQGQDELLRTLREQGVPVACCIPRDPELPSRLVRDFGVAHLFHSPLDCQEFARRLGLATRPDRAESLHRLWERLKDALLESVDVIEKGPPDQALIHSHRLAGSLGTVGIPRGTEVARRLEEQLSQTGTAPNPDWVVELRALVGAGPSNSGSAQPQLERPTGPPGILLVEDDPALGQSLEEECRQRGMLVRRATSLDEARTLLALEEPAAVVLDLVLAGESGYHLLQELSEGHPDLPVVVLTGLGGFQDRVMVARLGGRGFLHKPVPPTQVLDEVQRQLDRIRERKFTLLAVDDDPALQEALQTYLTDPQIRIVTLIDPLQFWAALEHVGPDMVMLDLDMPHVTGLDICRALRGDPQHYSLPILVLTAHNDPATISRVFAAGADDFVSKPFVGPELQSRINSRLERFRLLRDLIETDPLTGLSNRRKAAQTVDQFLRLAQRQRQPLSIALIDVDHFKSLNDNWGHAVGDQVLRRLGELLRQWFRGEDVVARWGGEEFLVGMYGMSLGDGVHRLADLLETVQAATFWEEQEQPVTFSAGVSQFPRDGTELGALARLADEALYLAKQSGRDRVMAYGLEPEVVVLTEDPALLASLGQSLRRRSYTVRTRGSGLTLLDARSSFSAEGPQVLILEPDQPVQEILSWLRRWLPEEV